MMQIPARGRDLGISRPARAKKFTNSGDVNDEHRLREEGWDHLREIASHLVEMRYAGEDEHDGKRISDRVVPRVEGRDAERSDTPQDQPRTEQYDQH
jgi:hypothetical protein